VPTQLEKTNLIVEKLHHVHKEAVSSFFCGRPDEDDFLKHDALPSQRFRLSETLLLFERGRKNKIISYVTITVGSFQLSKDKKLKNVKISDKPFRVFSNHIPCLLIGKLATDKSETGRGGARHLIDYALERAINANLPIPFVALHTYPDMIGFYEKIGFEVAFHPTRKMNGQLATMCFELRKNETRQTYQ